MKNNIRSLWAYACKAMVTMAVGLVVLPGVNAENSEIGRDYILKVAATSNTLAERMRVTQAGLVGIGKTPLAQLDVSGTVSATMFIGNGAGLTNIPGGAVDRISTTGVASGATLGAVVADRGTVSFTLAGVAGAAYLHSTLGLVVPAISTTTGNVAGVRLLVSTNDSAATPGLTWGGDPNTGMFQVAADTIGFATNGTEAMRIDASNRVGINTALTASATLSVNGPILTNSNLMTGTASGASEGGQIILGYPGIMPTSQMNSTWNMDVDSLKNLRFFRQNVSGVAFTPMTMAESGQVGIGISTPSTTLHVGGSIRIANGGEACDANRTGTMRYTSGVFQICDGTGYATILDTSATITNAPATDRLISGTTSLVAASGGTFTYAAGGNANLNVSGAGANVLQLGEGRTTNNYAYIDFVGDATYTDYGLRLIRDNTGPNASSWLQHRGTGSMVLQTVDSASILFNMNSIERMRVHTNGFIGISNTNPAYALDITGGLRTSSEIISTNSNQFRMVQGNYGSFWRNDGSNTYLLLTASGDQYGTWNALRPFTVNNALGVVSMGNGLAVTGVVTATSFSGNGSALTNINAATATNADLLDGYDSTDFIRKTGGYGASTNANNIPEGFSQTDGASLTNFPSASANWQTITVGNNGRGMQFTSEYGNNNSPWWRIGTDGWQPWRKIWTNANHGSGSGLNADLLDGIDSTAFLQRSGGTMTGGLVLAGTGTNGFYAGNGDAATYSTYNFVLQGWYGMAMRDYSGTIRGIYNFRTGSWDVLGGYSVNGATVWHANNDGSGSGLDADSVDGIDGNNLLQRSGGTMTGGLTINNNAPTIAFQDTDNYSGFIHMNGNTMHFLSSNANNASGWAIRGAYWPMTIDMSNDNITMGGNLNVAEGNVTVSGNVTAGSFTGNGSGLTNITASNADLLDGIDSTAFLRSGQTYTGDNVLTIGGSGAAENWSSAGLEIREVGLVGTGQNASTYAPSIAFHWANTTAAAIKMYSDGSLRFRANSNDPNAYANIHANNLWLAGIGDWISNRLGQDVRAGSNPNFANVWIASLGGNATDVFMGKLVNTWHASNEGASRFYFANGARTYIRANGGDGIIASFRGGDEADKVHIAQDGNIYSSRLGVWLADWLNQDVKAGANPNFGNVYLGYLGDWMSNRLDQNVKSGASVNFDHIDATHLRLGDARFGNGITNGVVRIIPTGAGEIGLSMRRRGDQTAAMMAIRNANDDNTMMRISADGNVAGTGAYTTLSDRRTKHAIEDTGLGLKTIEALRPRYYVRNGQTHREVGFIAQEVETVLPEAVTFMDPGNPKSMKAIQSEAIVAALVGAVKELKAENAKLRSEFEAYKKQNQ